MSEPLKQSPRDVYCRAYSSQYRVAHREEVRAKQRIYNRARYVLHREKQLAQQRASYARNKEKTAATHRAYYVANREKLLNDTKIWAAANRERRRLSYTARRARRIGNGGSHTIKQWLDKCQAFANCCAYCGDEVKLTRDHVVPLLRGGTNDIENIVPACLSCNSSKAHRLLTEWIPPFAR